MPLITPDGEEVKKILSDLQIEYKNIKVKEAFDIDKLKKYLNQAQKILKAIEYVKEQNAMEELTKKSDEYIRSYSEQMNEKIHQMQTDLTASLQSISSDAKLTVSQAEDAIVLLQSECEKAQSTADRLKPEVENKIADVSSNIENFTIQTNSKLENLSKMISDSVCTSFLVSFLKMVCNRSK